jgi:hypothetical protein
MAIATNGTKLLAKKKADNTFTELVGMKDFTDMGAKADRIETTTLNSSAKTYIRGMNDTPELEFTFNYENTTDAASAYSICTGLAAETDPVDFELMFPDGTFYSWSGQCSIYVKAGKVNAVLEFDLGVTATVPIVLNAAVASN